MSGRVPSMQRLPRPLIGLILASAVAGCRSPKPRIRHEPYPADQVLAALRQPDPSMVSADTLAVGVLFREPEVEGEGYAAYVEIWSRPHHVASFLQTFEPSLSPAIRELLSRPVVIEADTDDCYGYVDTEPNIFGLLAPSGSYRELQSIPQPWLAKRRAFLSGPLRKDALALIWMRAPPRPAPPRGPLEGEA